MSNILIKLGGSVITDKYGECRVNEDNIERICKLISRFKANNPDSDLIIVHGAGSYAHPIMAKAEETRDLEYGDLIKVRQQMSRLQSIIQKALEKENLSVAPETLPLYLEPRGWKYMVDDWKKLSSMGKIPLLHGNLVLTDDGGEKIVKISGDDLIKQIGFRWKIPMIVIASKHPVCSKDPDKFPDAKPIKDVTPAVFESIHDNLTMPGYRDTTGAMLRKLEVLKELSRAGASAYIVTLKGFENIFSDPEAVLESGEGTRIIMFPELHKFNFSTEGFIYFLEEVLDDNYITEFLKEGGGHGILKKISREFKSSCIEYPKRGGKALRPLILIASYRAVSDKESGNLSHVLPAMAAVEFLHNFSLVHDDLMDDDEFRRGLPALHKIYGEDIAILSGDILLTKVVDAILKLDVEPERKELILNKITRTLTDLSVGQSIDIGFEREWDVSIGDYIAMITGKTARLFETCAEVGAILGNGSESEIKALRDYGLALGVGFQMIDDVLGLIGDPEMTGKPVGSDVQERKKTYPIIYALSKLDDKTKNEIFRTLYIEYADKDVPQEKLDEITELIENTGAIKETKKAAKEYIGEAKDALKVLKESTARKVLEQTADSAYYRLI